MSEKTYPKTSTPQEARSSAFLRPATAFYVWAYLAAVAVGAAFVLRAAPATPRAWLFGIAAVLSYAVLYSLPTLLVMLAVRPLRRRGIKAQVCAGALVVLATSACQLGLGADYTIHGLFGFHINGFVINLITTPEGIASMGADPMAERIYASLAVACVAVNALVWWALVHLAAGWRVSQAIAGRPLRWAVVVLVLLALGERITYGLSHIQARPDVMTVAAALPGYMPTTFRSIAAKFGVESKRRIRLETTGSASRLDYPRHAMATEAPEKQFNIVWLVCESLRADMLTPEIMPRTWAFAQESQRFTRHYSGGNGTRMGVFTLFYGLPGNYWFKFLDDRRPPVFMDRLQELGYELQLSTSAAFSYPEFDKTVFAHVPSSSLYTSNQGEGWKTDRHHVARLKTWLEGREKKKPFFAFHFFESAHARYYFPPESVIRRPYLEDFNYATMNLKRDIELIRNRYVNAVNHLDSQLGEVIDALRARGELDHTIVMITGDHGEEFLETGRWGHNSAFTEPQLRVPLVVYLPGRAPAVIDHPTSHVDLAPTLLPLLGVKNPTTDYSVGENLFSDASRLLTFSDWDRIAFSDGQYKATFPLNAGTQIGGRITTADDQPVADEGAALRQQGPAMARLVKMMSLFTGRN